MKKNKFILLLSIILPLLSIFFDRYNHIDKFRHTLGIPFDFFKVLNNNLPINRLEIFKSGNLTAISFRIDIYIASVIVFYCFLQLLSLLIQKFADKNRQ